MNNLQHNTTYPEKPDTGSQSISRRLFLATGRVSIYQGLGLVLGFGLQTLISRTCGASGVGVYTLFTSWLVILSVITVPGLENILVYFLPRMEGQLEQQRLVVRTCLFITMTVSLALGGLLLAFGDRPLVWIGLPANARIAFAFSVVFFSFGKLLDAVFLGMKDASRTGYYNIVRLAIRMLLCVPILVFPHAAWKILFAAISIECGVTLAFRYLRIQKRYSKLITFNAKDAPDPSITAGKVVRTSFPMLGINLIEALYPFLDKAILGILVPLALVGVYRISEYVASLNSLFVAPFVAFWPFISNLSANRRLDELGSAYKNVTLAIITLMVPFSLALIELSGFVLSFFGRSFVIQGAAVFLVLTVGTMIDSIAGPAGAVLRLADHYRVSLLINSVLIVVYCAASVLLTRKYGIMGAAVARTGTLVLANVVNVAANYVFLRIFPYTLRHGALLACGASILILRFGLLSHHPAMTTHFAIAFAEVIAFSGCAWFILRKQLQQVPRFLRTFVSAQG